MESIKFSEILSAVNKLTDTFGSVLKNVTINREGKDIDINIKFELEGSLQSILDHAFDPLFSSEVSAVTDTKVDDQPTIIKVPDPEEKHPKYNGIKLSATTISSSKSLYKDRVFTDDETYIIKAYLNKELKGPEAAETLNLDTKEFYLLVEQYKRAHNIKGDKKKSIIDEKLSSQKAVRDTRPNPNVQLVDFDKAYNDIKRGYDSIAAIAKDYNIPYSTFFRQFNNYIKHNNLDPIDFNSVRKDSKKPKVNKEVSESTEKSFDFDEKVKESVASRNKALADVGSKVNMPDGWQLVNGTTHFVKDGIIIQ